MPGVIRIDHAQMENAILNAIKNGARTRNEIYYHLYQVAKIHASIMIYDRHINSLINEGKIHRQKIKLKSGARHILSIPKRPR